MGEKMNCEDYRKKFDLYVDEELKPREAFELETHLKTCFHCKAEMGVIQRTVRLIGELKPLVPPENFNKEILREMGFEVVPAWRRAVSIAFVASAGAWAFLFFPWLLRSLRSSPDLIKSILHLPARLTVFTGFSRALMDSFETIYATALIILRNIPSIYWMSIVFTTFLLTLLFIKSISYQLKEANHVHNSH
jgi:hypothetical protein